MFGRGIPEISVSVAEAAAGAPRDNMNSRYGGATVSLSSFSASRDDTGGVYRQISARLRNH